MIGGCIGRHSEPSCWGLAARRDRFATHTFQAGSQVHPTNVTRFMFQFIVRVIVRITGTCIEYSIVIRLMGTDNLKTKVLKDVIRFRFQVFKWDFPINLEHKNINRRRPQNRRHRSCRMPYGSLESNIERQIKNSPFCNVIIRI